MVMMLGCQAAWISDLSMTEMLQLPINPVWFQVATTVVQCSSFGIVGVIEKVLTVLCTYGFRASSIAPIITIGSITGPYEFEK
jgi:hypothetical protein